MSKNGVIQWDTTAANNTDVDGISIAENCAVANLNNMGRAIMARVVERFGSSVSVASASTVALGDQEEQYVTISGTTTITSFGTPGVANKFGYWVKFDGVLTLTHNGTSLILPGGANITTAAGDMAFCQHEGSGNWRVAYFRANGTPVVGLQSSDITGQAALTAPDHAADFLLISDTSASGALKKILPKYISPIVNRYYAEYASNADLTTAIPFDDTIPTSTEGTQILSVSVTTTTATQRVRLKFSGFGQCNSANGHIAAAFFRDSTCVGVSVQDAVFTTAIRQWYGVAEDAPGAAATYTYTVRVGSDVGTVRMNGSTSSRVYGGAAKATLIAELIEP